MALARDRDDLPRVSGGERLHLAMRGKEGGLAPDNARCGDPLDQHPNVVIDVERHPDDVSQVLGVQHSADENVCDQGRFDELRLSQFVPQFQ